MRYLAGILIMMGFALQGLQAQGNSFYIGANAGTNFSKYKHTVDLAELYSTNGSVTGINGGFSFGMQLGNFTINSGLGYIHKGGKFQTDNFTDATGTGFYSATEKLNYLQIPLTVGYRLYVDPSFGFSFAMGPSFNVGIGGKGDEITEYFGSEDIIQEHYDVKFGSGVNDDYRNLQVGFLISPGIFVELNETSKLTLNLAWERGLGDMFNPRYKQANDFFDTYKGNQLFRSTIVTVGYEHHLNFDEKY